MNVSVYDILAHTPPWVFILFAYLMWISVLRLRPSIRQLGKIFITPVIFIVWGIVGLFRYTGDFSLEATRWAIGAVLGGALGIAGGMTFTVDRPRQLVLLRGSVMPMIRIMLIFGAHYGLQVAAALHPDQRDSWLTWDTYVSGASAGYYVGWSIRFLKSYRVAPQADLAPVVMLKG
jgi:hypothetical protein